MLLRVAKLVLAAAVSTGAVAGAADLAPAPAPTHDDLRREIESLQTRIREIEVRQAVVSEQQVQETVDRVLADAERRSQLFAAEGFTAGWDNGFVLRSSDGAYVLRPGMLLQFRNVTDYRENADADGDDDIQHGFEIRRALLIFQGNAISPNLGYFFQWEWGKNGNSQLLDAFVTYKIPDTKLVLKAGQYFDPVGPELRDGPPRRLAVEPSVADFLIAGGREDRVQGASIIYGAYAPEAPTYLEFMVHDGMASKNTDYTDVNANFGVAGRAEVKCFGDWPSYRDFTAASNKNDLLVFGVGADYTDAPNASTLLAQADAQWEPGKLALFGSLLMRYTDARNTAAEEAFDFGGVAQAAYLFSDRCEGFVRYSLTQFDEAPVDADDTIHEICVGTNYYVVPSAPHRAKVTVDLTYLPNGAPASLKPFSIAGGTDDAEVVLRAQFQLFL